MNKRIATSLGLATAVTLFAIVAGAQAKPAAAAAKPGTAASSGAAAQNKEFQTAIEYLQRGRVDLAEPILQKLYKAAPENAEVNSAMGTLTAVKGDPQKALGFFEKSLKIKPTPAAYAGMAATLADMGRPQDAVTNYKKALALDPANIGANFSLAGLYMQGNAFADAKPLLERVTKAAPAEAEPAYLLALCLSALNQPVQARATLMKLPPEAREIEQIQLLIGSADVAIGDKAEAKESFEHALRLNPLSITALVDLGNMAIKEGQTDQGIALLERAWHIDRGSYVAGFTLAMAYHQAGKLEQARSVLASLLMKGETPDIFNLLGRVEDEMKMHASATPEFQRAVELEPSERNYYDLGYSHLRYGSAADAEAVFREGLTKMPLSARLAGGLGAAYLAQGKFPQAVDALKAFAPKDAAADNPLGHRLADLAATGQKDDAKLSQVIEDMGKP